MCHNLGFVLLLYVSLHAYFFFYSLYAASIRVSSLLRPHIDKQCIILQRYCRHLHFLPHFGVFLLHTFLPRHYKLFFQLSKLEYRMSLLTITIWKHLINVLLVNKYIVLFQRNLFHFYLSCCNSSKSQST